MTAPIIASIAFVTLVTGLLLRKHRRIHPPLMLTAIAIDIGVVIYLQLAREVVQQAVLEEHSLLQHGHILSSSAALALYFPTLVLGIRQWLGKRSAAGRRWHIRVALTAFSFRTLGFVLMFFV